MTLGELEALLDTHTPRWRSQARIISLDERRIVVTALVDARFARTAGVISSPAAMALADRAAYYLTLSLVPMPEAVTTNLAIHFLTLAPSGDLVATATMMRLGKRSAVSAVDIIAGDELVAHATVTYALPVIA